MEGPGRKVIKNAARRAGSGTDLAKGVDEAHEDGSELGDTFRLPAEM